MMSQRIAGIINKSKRAGKRLGKAQEDLDEIAAAARAVAEPEPEEREPWTDPDADPRPEWSPLARLLFGRLGQLYEELPITSRIRTAYRAEAAESFFGDVDGFTGARPWATVADLWAAREERQKVLLIDRTLSRCYVRTSSPGEGVVVHLAVAGTSAAGTGNAVLRDFRDAGLLADVETAEGAELYQVPGGAS